MLVEPQDPVMSRVLTMGGGAKIVRPASDSQCLLSAPLTSESGAHFVTRCMRLLDGSLLHLQRTGSEA